MYYKNVYYIIVSDGHDHDFSRSPIVDQFLTIVDLFTQLFFIDRVIILIAIAISIVLLYKRMNYGLLYEPLMIHAVLASTHPFTPSYQYIYIIYIY